MDPAPNDAGDPAGPLPAGQRIFDNMYLMLVLGVLVMLVVFTAWGIWEIFTMPKGTLP
jgi:hypothetical protein